MIKKSKKKKKPLPKVEIIIKEKILKKDEQYRVFITMPSEYFWKEVYIPFCRKQGISNYSTISGKILEKALKKYIAKYEKESLPLFGDF